MKAEFISGYATRFTRWSAIALAASIPISTALDNVLLVVILAAWMLSGYMRDIYHFFFKNKVLLYPVAMFGLLAFGTLYGESPQREALAHVWKYADLLFIPIFAIAFRERETRIQALLVFAITIAIIVVFSYLLRMGILPKLPFITGDAALPTVFKHKITHSILVAFGAFLFVWLGSTTANHRLRLVWYALALLAAFNVLLIVPGATGYGVLLALTLVWVAERIGRRSAARAVLVIVSIAAALILIPNPFQDRVMLTQKEIRLWNPSIPATESTSAGLRLEFYKNTLDIISSHPFVGVGTGGFPKAYAQQVKHTGMFQTHNPHNEFLNIAAQIGIVGLLALIAMFSVQWRSAGQLATPMEQSLARGLVLTLVSGCMVNSLLLDHAEGLFYAWMSGLLYGGLKCNLPKNLPEKSAAHT